MTSVEGSVSDLLDARPFRSVLVDGPLRTVVRYAATPDEDNANSQAIIAKFYRDGEAARAFAIVQAVRAAVHSSVVSGRLSVPRPLGFDAERQVVLQEEISGVRFDLLLSGPDALRSLDLAGRALAALHGLDLVLPGGPRQMADHIRELIRPHPSRLADAIPDFSPRIDQILDALFELDRSWRPRRRDAAVHRDIHPKQLFREGECLRLIDWDLGAMGDPALDLGNLAASLRARWSATDAAIDVLLRGYASSGAPDVLERVAMYEALTYVRLSCKRFRLGASNWREECADLLGRAERCLGLVT